MNYSRVVLWLSLCMRVGLAAILNSDPASSKLELVSTICEYYNASCFTEAHKLGSDDITHCQGNQTCPSVSDHNCFAVWGNKEDDGDTQSQSNKTATEKTSRSRHRSGLEVKMMGCLLKSDDCEKRDKCVETKDKESAKGRHLFCCCRGDYCNDEFRWEPVMVEEADDVSGGGDGEKMSPTNFYIFLYTVVPLLGILVVVVIWVVYKQRKAAHDILAEANQHQEQQLGESPPSPKLSEKPDLLEIKAEGFFGKVYKGKIGDKLVAVKVFPMQQKQSWLAEQEIYKLPRMNHENILKFMGVDRAFEDFWLITEFHEKGSLCDFLKSQTVSWDELCKIANGIASGLAHLHEELPPRNTEDRKLAVAHRDFKSKNVLIKSDLTACIGDFGLALIFEPDKPIGDTHGQVGTRRYMAPEVLEGAITFSRDSFLRIDMYACGLVLWELASRCHMPQNAIIAKEYKLPFEEEISHATLEQMQELVVNRKVRPSIQDSWSNEDSCLRSFVMTITECWDQDAEARLSASTVKERIKLMSEVQANNRLRNEDDNSRNIDSNNVRNILNSGGGGVGGEQHEMIPLITDYINSQGESAIT